MELLADFLLRWTHFFAGIIWIGHNYANVVQHPAFKPLAESDLVSGASPRFMAMLGREHGTFRYASLVAWLSGAGMLWQRGILFDALTLRGFAAITGTALWIGTLMTLNLWLVLWPHQKKVLGFVPAAVGERIRCARVSFLSSRTNTMLSIPLLFFMAAGQHGTFLFS